MRKAETQEQMPLTVVPVEREEVATRALRALPVVEVAQRPLTTSSTEHALTPATSHTVLPARRPFARALEKALNGGDSAHEPWADLFETLAIALASGMTTPDALRYAGRNAPRELRSFCENAARQTEKGAPLHCKLARYASAPAVIAPILEHGTLNGTLESAARQVSKVLRRLADVDRKFAYSVISPDISLVLGICALMPLAPFVVGLFPQSVWLMIACVAACSGASFAIWQRRHRLALRQPRTSRMAQIALLATRGGQCRRALATARWARTLSALVDSGVPISSALEAAADSARNSYYAHALHRAAARTREGRPLYESLAGTQLLPPRLLEMIRTGETAGDLTNLLDRFADTMDDDAKMLAAQRFGQQFIAARLLLAGLIVIMLGMGLGADLGTAVKAGLAVFGAGLIISWLLFQTQARNEL